MKTNFFFIFISIITLFSCSNNDGDSSPDGNIKSNILGRWKIESINNSTEGISQCVLENNYYNIYSDNTLLLEQGYHNNSQNCILDKINQNYTVVDSTLIAKWSNGTNSYEFHNKIIEATDTELVLATNYTKVNENGKVYETTIDPVIQVIKYKKVN